MDQSRLEIQQVIEELKQSRHGRKISAVDARMGRIYSLMISLGWFALAVFAAAIGYLAFSLHAGWITVIGEVLSASVAFYAIWRGLEGVLRPRRASDYMIDELQSRLKPLSWAVDFVGSVRRRTDAKAL